MAGVNTILRIIGAVVVLFVIAFVTAVGFTLWDALHTQLGPPASLGWNSPDIAMFMALGLIGLTMTVIIWLIVAPIRNDVRQETRPP